MKFYCFLLVLVVGLGLSGRARGAEPGCVWWRTLCQPVSQQCPCCLNDYVPKPSPPCPCPVCNCGPNDYCPKPLPRICPFKYTGIDDYCPKPCPLAPASCYPLWYSCGSGEVGNQPKCGCVKTSP